MDPKITTLFILIGTIVTLSYVGNENLGKIKRRFDSRVWYHRR